MGLLTLLPRLPVLPIQVTIRIAELIQEETERELRDPARVRRQLEDAERQHAVGGISEDELSRIQHTVTGRLLNEAPVNPRQPVNRRQPKRGDDRND